MTNPEELTLDEAREFARAVLRAFPGGRCVAPATPKTTKEHA